MDEWYAAHLILAIALVLAVPAVLGLMHMLREREVAYGHLGGGLAMVGLLATHGIVAIEGFVGWQAGAASGTDAAAMTALFERVTETTGVVLPFFVMSFAFTVGMLFLAAGLYRARAVQSWTAAMLGIGPVVFAVGSAMADDVVTIIGAAVLLVGFVQVGRMVLAESDEEWEHTPEYPGSARWREPARRALRPARLRARGSLASRTLARSRTRRAEQVELVAPDHRVAPHPGLAAARGHLGDRLALERRLVELAPRRSRRKPTRACARRSRSRRARTPGRAASSAPSSDHSAPEMPPPQPVSGTPRGSLRIDARVVRRAGGRRRRIASESAPFCGPNSGAASSHGVRTSQTRGEADAARRAAQRLEHPAAAVHGRRASAARRSPGARPRPPLRRSARRFPPKSPASGSSSPGSSRAEPARGGGLDDRRLAVVEHHRTRPRPAGRARRSRSAGTLAAPRTAAVPSPPSATGSSSASRPAVAQAGRDRRGGLGRAEGALELVGRDEDRRAAHAASTASWNARSASSPWTAKTIRSSPPGWPRTTPDHDPRGLVEREAADTGAESHERQRLAARAARRRASVGARRPHR